MSDNSDLVSQLLECEVFKVGDFMLKSGAYSPVYIDLRRIISFPKIIVKLAEAVRSKQLERNLKTDFVCGVPYTALPVASVFSSLYDVPMVMKRKEAKNYGTKKLVEGVFPEGSSCLIIEDVVSSGLSVVETVQALRDVKLNVTDCIVIIDRMQGGKQNLEKEGIVLHSLFNINEIFSCYCSVNKVDAILIDKVNKYLIENSFIPIKKANSVTIPFIQRANKSAHPVSKRLFEIMNKKQTNLCVSADTVDSNNLLKIAAELGQHICMLKTHVDILEDFKPNVVKELRKLAEENNFLILEDRKFADIGNTVAHQYKNGVYKILEWADIVTVHGIPGSGIIEALKQSAGVRERACVLIAEMSSKGALIDDNYQEKIIEMAENNPDFVIGYVCQRKLSKYENMVHLCPGVNISHSDDALGQQYKSPEDAVKAGVDIIIVGRGIYGSSDIVSSAIEYKNRAYNAYMTQVQK